MEKFYLTGRIIRRFMGLNTENLKEVNVNLDLVVAKQAEYRSVVDAYDAMIASIASTQFSIDIQAEDDLSSLQTLLSNQQQILNRIVLYIIETIKIANINALKDLVLNIDAVFEIHDNTYSEIVSVKQALELLIQGKHFNDDDDTADIEKSDFDDEIVRLETILQEIKEKLLGMLV